MGFHAEVTGTGLHVPAFVQDTDPGAVGAGVMWIDTSLGAGQWVSKLRNVADDGWEEVGKTPGGSTFPDIPHYSKGTGNLNVVLTATQAHIYDGQTVKISCFDLISCIQGGEASPTYTFYIRDTGAFGAGNADPTAEYVEYTTAQSPAQIYIKVSDGTTTTTEMYVLCTVALTA